MEKSIVKDLFAEEDINKFIDLLKNHLKNHQDQCIAMFLEMVDKIDFENDVVVGSNVEVIVKEPRNIWLTGCNSTVRCHSDSKVNFLENAQFNSIFAIGNGKVFEPIKLAGKRNIINNVKVNMRN